MFIQTHFICLSLLHKTKKFKNMYIFFKILILFYFILYFFDKIKYENIIFLSIIFFPSTFRVPNRVLLRKENINENLDKKWKEINFGGK